MEHDWKGYLVTALITFVVLALAFRMAKSNAKLSDALFGNYLTGD